MAKIDNSMECLDALVEKMLENGLTRISYADGDFKLSIEKALPQGVPMLTASAVSAQVPCAGEKPEAPAVPAGKIVKSPIVGTFYSAPAPDKEPFIQVGQKVKKGDVLMIIESMKLMNEITSEYDGTIAEIMVCSGAPVEFDQPILRIE